MWKLLKTEIVYNKMILLNLMAMSLLSFLLVHFWPVLRNDDLPNPNTGFIAVGHLLYFFISVMLQMTSWGKEHRNSRHVQLPVPVLHIGLMRLFLFVLYWAVLIGLFIVYTLVSRYFFLDRATLLALGSQTGFAFIAYTLFFTWSDYREHYRRKKPLLDLPANKIFGFITLLVFVALCFITTAGIVHNYQGKSQTGFDAFLNWIYQSPTGPFLVLFFGLALSSCSVVFFSKRKIFLG